MVFAMTVLLTFCLVLLAVFLFWKLGSPVYRVEKVNVIRLLELVVAGQATESDWHVFSAYTIHHDVELADIQQRCLDIAEREFVGGKGKLFTPAGQREIAEILQELKTGIEEKADDDQNH